MVGIVVLLLLGGAVFALFSGAVFQKEETVLKATITYPEGRDAVFEEESGDAVLEVDISSPADVGARPKEE